MTIRSRTVAAAFAAGLMMIASSPAFADRIDGDWCFAAQNLHIDGPAIRTPGGSNIKGDYSRHGFSYVVPAAEAEAGIEIDMRLLSEEAMVLSRRKGGKPEETWKRCRVTS